MADNSWQDKSYGEYFSSLEKRLNTNDSSQIAAGASGTDGKNSKSRKKHGVYKVLRIRKSVFAVIFAVVLAVCVIAVTSGSAKKDKQDVPVKSGIEAYDGTEEIIKTSYSFNNETADIPSSNDAKCAIVVDRKNHTVIAARNPHERAYPASTTKLMTLLVAAENIENLDDTFTMTLEITDPLFIAKASVAGFLSGETITVKDLMYGTVLPSGADAATALAIMAAGSEEGFVKLMNSKAEELGLENTHYANPTGLHDEQNYSTVYDMAIILDAVLQNELCKQIVSAYQYTTSDTAQNPGGILLTNTIFEYMYGTEPETATILGGKTGYVNESGYCIASYGECNANGNQYIVVTFGNSSRWPAFFGQIDLYKQFAK